VWAAIIVAVVTSFLLGHWLFPPDTPSGKLPFTQPSPERINQHPSPEAGAVMTSVKDGQKYVWIPPGTFQMGCSAGDNECNSDEKPAHKVTITKGFWLGQTPVTQASYLRVMGVNPSHFHGARRPVESVTWGQARDYCELVGMRLPTEAEWEYAARAGSDSFRYGDPDNIGWHFGNSQDTTHEVGLKQANQWNLYDMLGNVWEWVADWFDENYYQESPLNDPKGPSSGLRRALRVSAWRYSSSSMRSSHRVSGKPDDRDPAIGFRCAWETIP
jgi:formylglycine-generating enzyme required for sulfatase activity